MHIAARFVLVAECKVDLGSLRPPPEGWRCYPTCKESSIVPVVLCSNTSPVFVNIHAEKIEASSNRANCYEEQEAKALEFAKTIADLDPSTLTFKAKEGRSEVVISNLRTKPVDDNALKATQAAFPDYTVARWQVDCFKLIAGDHRILFANRMGISTLLISNTKTRSRPAEWVALAKEVAVRLEALEI